MRRVIAFYMDEAEAAECLARMPGAVRTDSFFLGEIEEGDVAGLTASGVIVQYLDAAGRPSLRARPEPARPLGRGSRAFGVAGTETSDFDIKRPNYYRVQLNGPMLEEWRTELAAAGASVIDVLPEFQITAKIASDQVEAVQSLPFVRGIELEPPDVSMPREVDVAGFRTKARTGAKNVITYDIVLREETSLMEVLRWLEEQHVNISASAGNKIRVHVLEDSPVIEDCASLPDVAFIEPYLPPKLHNDLARVLLGLESTSGGSAQFRFPYEGEGQIIGIADTGIDERHPDLGPGRIAGVVALGRRGDASDPNGHGTHVAGSAVGDGTASGGQLRGAAPKARLFFQSVLDARGDLGGLPFRMHDLFDEAYRAGVRVHNNSWGAATQSSYRISSNEVDDYIHSHKDLLVVISAGNEGTGKDPESGRRNAATGCVEWLSVGSPATAKNTLTVGASQNNRSDPKQGYSTQKYGDIWPDDYADAPVKDEAVSGNPESLAAFSSRGPCDTYRIKPDVVAPGTDILSCRSSRASLRNFWGPHTGTQYAYMGGTSMAAPLVAGCAAAIREYYKKRRRHEASAALLRATIINSTRWLSGGPAVADHPNTPNYHQGFGCVYMPYTVPNAQEPKLKLAFSDLWQKPQQAIQATGDRRRFTVKVRAGYPLRICLAYTDPPGPAIVNNLNLLVQGPDKKKLLGNEQVPMTLNIPDPTNNVEIVRVDAPAAGTWTIQISASNLLKPPQDFALVITGDLNGNLVQV